jgi:AcrR family transcriptional regulator
MQAMATGKSRGPAVGRSEPKRRKGSESDRAADGPPVRRRYRSDRRDRQAAETRADIVRAAIRLFGERGWSGTTMAAIAGAAGVAVETVYSGFGSKKAVLRQALDVAVVGDVTPVPLAERPEYQRMATGSRDERLGAGIELLAAVHVRTAPLWPALVEAAAGDPEVAAWSRELEERRRGDVVRSIGLVLGRPVDDATVDLAWALFGPEVFAKLVGERGWSAEAYCGAMRRLGGFLAADVPPAG